MCVPFQFAIVLSLLLSSLPLFTSFLRSHPPLTLDSSFPLIPFFGSAPPLCTGLVSSSTSPCLPLRWPAWAYCPDRHFLHAFSFLSPPALLPRSTSPLCFFLFSTPFFLSRFFSPGPLPGLSRCLHKVALPNVATSYVAMTQSGRLPPCRELFALAPSVIFSYLHAPFYVPPAVPVPTMLLDAVDHLLYFCVLALFSVKIQQPVTTSTYTKYGQRYWRQPVTKKTQNKRNLDKRISDSFHTTTRKVHAGKGEISNLLLSLRKLCTAGLLR